MAKKFKVFGILNIIDLIIVLILILGLVALFLAGTGKINNTPRDDVEKKNVEIDVMLRGEKISRKGEVFKAGDKTFITIRNVPYTKLEIIKAVRTPEKIAIPNPKNPSTAIAVEDPTRPYSYDFLITIADNAVITQDGPVIGGNKIKIGLPIMLEGYDYKLAGIVSDVRIKNNQE